jgi:hypothetical protein
MGSDDIKTPYDYTQTVCPELVEGPFFFFDRQKKGRCFDKLSTIGKRGGL